MSTTDAFSQKTEAYFVSINSLNLGQYKTFLNLSVIPKSEWREKIIECQKAEKLLLAEIKSFDSIILPESFKVSVSVKKERVKRNKTEIPVKMIRNASNGWNRTALEDEILNSENLYQEKYLTVYGMDRNKLDKLFQFKRKNFRLALVNQKI